MEQGGMGLRGHMGHEQIAMLFTQFVFFCNYSMIFKI